MRGNRGRCVTGLLAACLLVAAVIPCPAADFSFSATILAGMANSAQWELGIGPGAGNFSSNASLQPYYPNNQPRLFEMGYVSSTNMAFLRYYQTPTTFQQVNFAPGGPGLGGNSLWTIPLGSLFVSATRVPRLTSITVGQLSLGGGVQVLQPFSTTSLTASQNASGPVTRSMGNTVVFRTNATGNWLMSGTVSFAGLAAYVSGGANRTDLQFRADVNGTRVSTPEPPAMGFLAVGLILIGFRARHKQGGGAGN
jgi:hypothetical protein